MSWFSKPFSFENVTSATNSSISINGKNFSGKNITIKGGTIIIDNETINIDEKEINITVNGNIESLDVGACSQLNIGGDVKTVKVGSGSISVNKDAENVTLTSGDVKISGNVGGNTSTISGSVSVGGSISGSVKTTSGNISKL